MCMWLLTQRGRFHQFQLISHWGIVEAAAQSPQDNEMPRIATRSTLVNHRFPAFYACYLLKSVRTARATACVIL